MRSCRVMSFTVLATLLCLFAFVSQSPAKIDYPTLPKSDALNNLSKMKIGQLNVKDKPEYTSAFVDLASWAADRLAHPPFNGEELKTKPMGPPESIETLLDEVATWCTLPKRKEVDETNNQLDNARVMAEKFADRILFVMKDVGESKRLVRINAARMLVVVARLPTDALVPTFLKLIRENAYPLEVKLYAFQGLGMVLANVDPKDPTKGVISDMEKLAEVCKELDKWISTPYPLPKTTDPAYVEMAHVAQFIRREAVRALAQVKYSVVRDRQRQPIARPVWTLLRVATRSAADPAFSLAEQMEAVIGICRMRPDDLVNLDSVAYLVSGALLEFGVNHNEQKAVYQNNPRFRPTVAWKLYGYQLNEAMKQWKATVATLPAARSPDAVKNLVDAATTRFLTRLEQDGIMAALDTQQIVTWKSNTKPKVAQVFSDDPASAFTPD